MSIIFIPETGGGSGGGGGGINLIVDNQGNPLTQRSVLNFVGSGVVASDDAANSRTLISIPTGNSAFEFQTDFTSPFTGDTVKMRCSVATSITSGGAIRTGGTGATVDVLKNGVSILTTPLSLTTTVWTAIVLAANPTLFAAGDILSIILSGVSGSPTDILAAVYGSRATF